MVPSDFTIIMPAQYGQISIREIARAAAKDAETQQAILTFLGMLLRPNSRLVPAAAYCSEVVVFPVRRLTEAHPRGEVWAIAYGKLKSRDVLQGLWVLADQLNLPLLTLAAGRHQLNGEPIARKALRHW